MGNKKTPAFRGPLRRVTTTGQFTRTFGGTMKVWPLLQLYVMPLELVDSRETLPLQGFPLLSERRQISQEMS